MKTTIVVLALAALLGARAEATVVSTTSYNTAGVAFIAAPGATSQQSVLKGCLFSNNNAAPVCVTVAGSVSGDPSFMLCAASSATVSFPSGQDSKPDGVGGAAEGFFGELLKTTGTWKVSLSTLQTGALLTCSYKYMPLR